MFELVPGVGWLFLAYVAGTIIGMKFRFNGVIEATIDSLIDNGYLKHRRNSRGEIEILKHNED